MKIQYFTNNYDTKEINIPFESKDGIELDEAITVTLKNGVQFSVEYLKEDDVNTITISTIYKTEKVNLKL
jgi:hypothetical protein